MLLALKGPLRKASGQNLKIRGDGCCLSELARHEQATPALHGLLVSKSALLLRELMIDRALAVLPNIAILPHLHGLAHACLRACAYAPEKNALELGQHLTLLLYSSK